MSKPDVRINKIIEKADDLMLKQQALEDAPFGITIADMRQDDEPIIYANDGFTRISGYQNEEVVGRNCRFLQGEGTEEEPASRMREAIERDEAVQVELRNYRKSGELFWNEVTLSPLSNDLGEVTHYIGFQQDISKRKQYEKQLEEQRDDLTVLNEMVRHDIRNDLQVAMATMELLAAKSESADQAQISTALESITQAIDLTNTARDVAAVMLDEGSDYRGVPISQIIESELQDCQSSHPEADLSITGALPQVLVHANDLLASVFRNLFTNAIVHNDSDQPKVTVAAELADDEVVVTVSDNGPGIPDENLPQLFEKGWTGSESSGTGIGLYLASRLITNYGGDISLATGDTVESALGGATFVVRLPLADSEEGQQ